MSWTILAVPPFDVGLAAEAGSVAAAVDGPERARAGYQPRRAVRKTLFFAATPTAASSSSRCAAVEGLEELAA
ncbi:MAG TPA: hypothetical protein VIS07_17365 [Candidatus Binatia bacterium]